MYSEPPFLAQISGRILRHNNRNLVMAAGYIDTSLEPIALNIVTRMVKGNIVFSAKRRLVKLLTAVSRPEESP